MALQRSSKQCIKLPIDPIALHKAGQAGGDAKHSPTIPLGGWLCPRDMCACPNLRSSAECIMCTQPNPRFMQRCPDPSCNQLFPRDTQNVCSICGSNIQQLDEPIENKSVDEYVRLSQQNALSQFAPGMQAITTAWIDIPEIGLKLSDYFRGILAGTDMLGDTIMNGCAKVIRRQFGVLLSLDASCLQPSAPAALGTPYTMVHGRCLQFLHMPSPLHWILASNLDGNVLVYDSLCLDRVCQSRPVLRQIDQLFGHCRYTRVTTQCQTLGTTCGDYAIATAVHLCLGIDPSLAKFDEHQMRPWITRSLVCGRFPQPCPTL